MDISNSIAFGSYYQDENENNLYIRNNTVLDNTNIDLLCKECKGITLHLKSSTIVDDIFVKYQFDEPVDHNEDYPIQLHQIQPEFLVECPCCKKKTDHFICDAELSYAISNLNQKGYVTQFCCSGHNKYEPNIIFANFYKFDSKPIYWKADNNRFEKHSRVILRLKKKYRNIEHIEKAFCELNRWVSELPDLSNNAAMQRYNATVQKYNDEFDGDVISLIKQNNALETSVNVVRNYDEIVKQIAVLENQIKEYYTNGNDILGQETIITELNTKVETLKWVLMQEIDLIPKECNAVIKNPTLRTILDSDESFTFGEIKKAVNAALKKEDNCGYNDAFLKQLRKFNLIYLVGPDKLDINSRYKANLKSGFHFQILKMEE